MKTAYLFAILVSVIFITALPLKTSAIGQVTEPIIIKNAQRGQAPQATLTIINNDKVETDIGLLAKGDIASWTEFYTINDLKNSIKDLKMSAGSQAKIIARFNIPTDVHNGKYRGFVSVSKKFDKGAASSDQSSVSISQEIDREVTIEINGKEIIAFEVSVIPKTYDLAKNELLSIRLIYDNSGNIAITPAMQIKIKKDSQTIYNTIYPYPESQPAVKPGEIYEIPEVQVLTNNLETGKYEAEMSFSIDGKILQEKDFGFSVGIFAESAVKNDPISKPVISIMFDGFAGWLRNSRVLIISAVAIMLFAFMKLKGRQLETNNAGAEENEKNKI